MIYSDFIQLTVLILSFLSSHLRAEPDVLCFGSLLPRQDLFTSSGRPGLWTRTE